MISLSTDSSQFQGPTGRAQRGWVRILCSASAACIVAAACGGGSIQGAGEPGGLSDLESKNYQSGESQYGTDNSATDNVDRTVTAEEREVNGEDRVYFFGASKTIPILWATVHDKGQIKFSYLGKRYTADLADIRGTYEPAGSAGVLIAGATMPGGGKIGHSAVEVGEDAGPYMVTVLGEAAETAEGKQAADLMLSRCGSQACADTPSGGKDYTVKVGTKKIVENTTLGVDGVAEDGFISFELARYSRVPQKDTDDDGWGSGGLSNTPTDDRWDSLPPLESTPPSQANNSSSSSSDSGDGLLGSIGDLFSWENLLIAGAVVGGGLLAWDGLGVATGGRWGGDDEWELAQWPIFGGGGKGDENPDCDKGQVYDADWEMCLFENER